jgi:hypothetical protein
MKAAVTIAWRDLPKYFDIFYPTVKGQLENVEQAPSEITIIADKIHRNGEVVQIDCLPLIQMRHAHATFHCQFVHVVHVDDLDPELYDSYEFEKRPDWLSADSGVVLSLIDHTHVEWLQAVSAGKVERIMIDFVGTPTVTTIEFYVYADEKARSSTQARKLEIDQTGRLQYFEEMGLTGIWQTAAGKDMYQDYFRVLA